MEGVDKLTLELMMNRRQYKKYLATTDPVKYNENQEFVKKVKRYSKKMREMTSAFLENPEVSFNTAVNDMFIQYAKVLINYIEMKKYDESDAGFTDHPGGEDEVDSEEEGEEDTREGGEAHANMFNKTLSMSYKIKYEDHNP